MKRKLLILTLAISATIAMASCASGRASRGGCHLNQGYVGYGGR